MSDPVVSDDQVDLDWSGLEILSYDECRRLLSTEAVGRIAYVANGSPVVLPINFTLHGGSIVFRSGRGAKLESAVMHEPVCVEIDSWNVVEHTGWSVLAKGIAEHVVDGAELEELDRLPVRPWSRPDLRHEWIRVVIEDLSGRRIHQE